MAPTARTPRRASAKAPRTRKATKKAAAKGTKKADRNAAKKATKKAPVKKAAKKKAAPKKAKKAAAKKAPAKKAAKKPSTKKRSAAAKRSGATNKRKDDAVESRPDVEIDVELLDEVEDLVEDNPVEDSPAEPAPQKPASKKRKGPVTPTAPRAVKPPPKVADLEMDPEVLRFIDAIEKYKQEYSRPFPSWREVFYVLKTLGYERS